MEFGSEKFPWPERNNTYNWPEARWSVDTLKRYYNALPIDYDGGRRCETLEDRNVVTLIELYYPEEEVDKPGQRKETPDEIIAEAKHEKFFSQSNFLLLHERESRELSSTRILHHLSREAGIIFRSDQDRLKDKDKQNSLKKRCVYLYTSDEYRQVNRAIIADDEEKLKIYMPLIRGINGYISLNAKKKKGVNYLPWFED